MISRTSFWILTPPSARHNSQVGSVKPDACVSLYGVFVAEQKSQTGAFLALVNFCFISFLKSVFICYHNDSIKLQLNQLTLITIDVGFFGNGLVHILSLGLLTGCYKFSYHHSILLKFRISCKVGN